MGNPNYIYIFFTITPLLFKPNNKFKVFQDIGKLRKSKKFNQPIIRTLAQNWALLRYNNASLLYLILI